MAARSLTQQMLDAQNVAIKAMKAALCAQKMAFDAVSNLTKILQSPIITVNEMELEETAQRMNLNAHQMKPVIEESIKNLRNTIDSIEREVKTLQATIEEDKKLIRILEKLEKK